MKPFASLFLILILSACNLAQAPVTEEAVIALTVANTETTISETAIPTGTPLPTTSSVSQDPCAMRNGWTSYTVHAGDTLFSIAQRANSDVDTLVDANCLELANVLEVGQPLFVPQTVASPAPTSTERLVYWLASDNAVTSESIKIGCDTYVTPIQTQIAFNVDPNNNISLALEALFNATIQAPYRNHWGGLGLSVESVSIDGYGMAHIYINGNFQLVGVCGDVEIVQQILRTVFAQSLVQSAQIFIGGVNLTQLSDMSGRSDENSFFIRDSSPN